MLCTMCLKLCLLIVAEQTAIIAFVWCVLLGVRDGERDNLGQDQVQAAKRGGGSDLNEVQIIIKCMRDEYKGVAWVVIFV